MCNYDTDIQFDCARLRVIHVGVAKPNILPYLKLVQEGVELQR